MKADGFRALSVRAGSAADVEHLVTLDPVAGSDGGERRAAIQRWCRDGAVLVADTPTGLVGYCVVEYTFFEQGFVTMLMVAEPARGHGVGERLLRAAAASCRTGKLFTSTNLSNHPMQRLLQRIGWRSVGMVHGLDDGDPEVFYLYRPAGTAGEV
ncbi:GNAT family N-acetyltransferase [Nonomuraea sp. KC401]|uniref:GNAT family N-acetyltransferase n=1 Tax=unclassified Nonomuraea TaxID=2593643 RepID=UPI0010FF06CD|nr:MULTISPECIES: GNAT family N-acetyltransferase [unclassified Nonomuraea]NBE99922.1 GNAT family N-acetyltransferase [Nonomuraea sp. K271]TLF63143.1 GNAT family N-acetyltransferase [Nonomuraea sp. KC401]